MDKNPFPIVSVIMATYNRSSKLDETIANVLEQDYSSLELIIIDDGSTDSTKEILNHYHENPKVKIIFNDQNLGLQKSLNKGIQKASGKYIARIDDHDKWISKNKISSQVMFLEKNTAVGVVGTSYKLNEQKITNPITDLAIRNQILFRSPFCHVSVLMRMSILKKLNGYDENLPYSEDWDLWLRIGLDSKFANLPELTTVIFEEEKSLSDSFFLQQLPLNFSIIKKHWNHYPNKTKAFFYHKGLSFFFNTFPRDGSIHRLMNRIFSFVFISK